MLHAFSLSDIYALLYTNHHDVYFSFATNVMYKLQQLI